MNRLLSPTPGAEAIPVLTTQRIMMCVGMGLFGLFVFIALRLAPTPPSPQTPAYLPPQVPEARLRFVWLDAKQERIAAPLIARLQKLSPDFLLAENFDSADLMSLARALGMEKSAVRQNFQSTGKAGNSRSSFGVCAVSKYPLFDAGPLQQADEVFGVNFFSIVQGRKFMLASICTSPGGDRDAKARQLIASWRLMQRPPLVATGVFAKEMETGELVDPETGWFDGLTPFEQILPPQAGAPAPPPARMMFTEGWSCLAGGYQKLAGGQIFAWVDATSAHVVATTSATTAPSDPDEDGP